MFDYNKTERYIDRIQKNFTEIKNEAKKSPLGLSSIKLNEAIQKVSQDFLEEKKKFERNSKLPYQEKSIEDLRERFKSLNKEISEFRSNLPQSFKAKKQRWLDNKIIYSAAQIIRNPIKKLFENQMFSSRPKNIDAEPLIPKMKDKEKKRILLNKELLALKEEIVLLEKSSKINKKIQKFIKVNKRKWLKLKRSFITKDLHLLKEKIGYFNKAEQMHQDCKTLGGERITITTPDQVRLDSIFLDANKFRLTLANAGCKQATLGLKNASKQMHAVSLSKENFDKSGKQVIQALARLGVVSKQLKNADNINTTAGWQIVHDGEDILLVLAKDLEEGSSPFVQFNTKMNRWETKSNPEIDVQSSPIDTTMEASGTVIISSGNAGIYEQHKMEAAFFLLRNMNVMLFNFRGYGSSEGKPTATALEIDMESAYQCAKKYSGHADKQIVFKALCVSGSAASYVASKHPETHIILDQTYSSIKRVVKDFITDYLTTSSVNKGKKISQNKFRQFVGKTIGSVYASMMAPNINVDKNLARNKGKKAIIYSSKDEVMGISNVEENIKALSKTSQLDNLTLLEVPGEHGTSVIRVREKVLTEEEKDLLKDKHLALIEKNNDLKLKIVKKSAKKLFDEVNKLKEELAMVEKEEEEINRLLTKLKLTGQAQLEHFLNKAGLSLPSKDSLFYQAYKPVITPNISPDPS